MEITIAIVAVIALVVGLAIKAKKANAKRMATKAASGGAPDVNPPDHTSV